MKKQTMSLQERLERLFSEKEITLKKISAMLGVTPRTVQNYKWGRTVPKTYEKELTIYEIIDVLYETLPPKKPANYSKYKIFYRGIYKK